jgi:hypothetical protein
MSGLAVAEAAAGLRARAACRLAKRSPPPREHQAQLGIGRVRHRRLRPRRTPSTTRPTSCCCRCARCASGPTQRCWRATASACCSASTTATTATAAPTRWPGWRKTAAGRRHHRRRRRGLAAHLPARAGLRLQAGQLLVLPPRDGSWRHRGRGQQHLRRAPLLPAAGPGWPGARAAWRARSSTCRRSASVEGRLPLPLHAHRRGRRTVARIDSTTPKARCC